jgi:F-type H+-transporting ATPase subunit gamma
VALGVDRWRRDAGDSDTDTGVTPSLGQAGLVVALAVVLVLSVPAVFPSPYVYQPSTHVTEQQLAGYEAAVSNAAIGRKGAQFLKRINANVAAQVDGLGDRPALADVIGPVKAMLEAYDEGRIQQLHLVHNRFVNTMKQEPTVRRLLPLVAPDPDAHTASRDQQRELQKLQQYHWDYIYEPDAPEVLDALLQRYIEALVYQGVAENIACEMAARMVAMKSASDNAESLIDDLRLQYNKARQAAITQELTEIVSGAAAVSG